MVAKSEFRSHLFETLIETIVDIHRGIESFQGFLGGSRFRPSTVFVSLASISVVAVSDLKKNSLNASPV